MEAVKFGQQVGPATNAIEPIDGLIRTRSLRVEASAEMSKLQTPPVDED